MMLNSQPNLYAVLSDHQAVSLRGPDAQDYLQRLSTADFRNLPVGRFTPALLLNSTGKIQFFFKAIRLEPEHYLILAPTLDQNQTPAQFAQDALEKMHFRENFTLEAAQWTYLRVLVSNPALLNQIADGLLSETSRSDVGAFQTRPNRHGPNLLALNEGKWLAAPIQRDLGLVVPTQELAALTQSLREAGLEEAPNLKAYQLRAFDPAVPNELGPDTNPLEAHLTDAIHDNKGCYPGQEVIERIRSMGQVPRTLVQVRGSGAAPALPASILVGEQSAGPLTSAVLDPIQGGWVGLGFLKRIFAKSDSSYTIAGQDVNVILR